MPNHPLTAEQDAVRLHTLASYQILDTAPEQEFDDLTELASFICGTPIAVVSLVDADRQWFKSRIGLDVEETPREIAFCATAILDHKPLVVPNASQDLRFANNPLVTGELSVRFYAGVPLVAPDGSALGTLCVIDHKPRDLTRHQLDALQKLARQAMTRLELRRTMLTMQHTQEQIRISEEQLSLAVQAGGIGFWDWDMRANTVTMSMLHEELLGLPPTGKARPVQDFFDRIHPDDLPALSQEVNHAIANHTAYETEMRVVWPDGTIHWMTDSGSAQYDANGAPYRMNGTMAEITARKQVEHEMAVRQERYDLAVSAANTGVWEWYPESDAWYLSAQSLGILGYADPVEIWSMEQWTANLHPDDRPAVVEYIGQQIQDPTVETWRTEHRAMHKNGTSRWILVQARMIRRPDGSLVRMVGTHVDITEQRERERVLAEAKIAADEANRAKSDFLANMSHEIRTPMHGILGMSHLLAESPLNSEQHEFLEGIERSAQSLLTLVNDVLDFSKVEAGKMTLDIDEFDLADAVSDLEKQFRVVAMRKGLSLEVQVQLEKPCWLIGDVDRLRQLLINLLGNAVKFTAQGKIVLSVQRVGGTEACPLLRLSVQDSGIGIASEAIPQLFEPFSQLDSSRARRFEGTGLGLSICRRLTELMGGKMGVESQPGVGSTFWLELALPVADIAPRSRLQVLSNDLHGIPKRSGRVLVVEDNLINQRIMLERLKKLGLQADVAATGLEALAATEQVDYNLVLMDCQMPEMDGYEASRQMRASPLSRVAQVPILAMTANAMPGERERCLQAGMSAYLTKPIDEKELVKLLDHWLMRKKHGALGSSGVYLLPAVDQEALERLGGWDTPEDAELIVEIIEMFDSSTPERLQTMHSQAAEKNWPQVAMTAHSLKSSAGYLGASRVAQLCKVIERMCTDEPKDSEEILGCVAQLDAAFAEAMEALFALRDARAA